MSPQVVHALRQAAVLAGLAALGYFGLHQTELVQDPNVALLVAAAIAFGTRVLEGYRDQARAEEGKVIPADVAYDAVVELANPLTPNPKVAVSQSGAAFVADTQHEAEIKAVRNEL